MADRAARRLRRSASRELDHAIAHLRILTGQIAPPGARISIEVRGRASGGSAVTATSSSTTGGCRAARADRAQRRGLAAPGSRGRNRGSSSTGAATAPASACRCSTARVLRLGDTLDGVPSLAADRATAGPSRRCSPAMSPVAVAVRRRIDALARAPGHVLIVGETGTGKERVAQAIGDQRAPHPFVTLNSARAEPRSRALGAVRPRRAARSPTRPATRPAWSTSPATACCSSTRSASCSLDVQAELLRFLEDGSYRPLGATELRHSNARVVAATHVDLDQAVRNGKFRRDLLARLRASNTPLELPPLRERREDILELDPAVLPASETATPVSARGRWAPSNACCCIRGLTTFAISAASWARPPSRRGRSRAGPSTCRRSFARTGARSGLRSTSPRRTSRRRSRSTSRPRQRSRSRFASPRGTCGWPPSGSASTAGSSTDSVNAMA